MAHAVLAPGERYEILRNELFEIVLPYRPVEHGVSVFGIPENEGDIECANLRHDSRQGRPGNKRQIERAELEGLQHLDFAAERGVRILLHREPTAAALETSSAKA